MKKLLFIFIIALLSVSLFGCNTKTTTAKNLEYLGSINNEKANTLVFKNENGDIVGFNFKDEQVIILAKNKKYDVEYTLSDSDDFGGMFVNVIESKENK